MTKNQRVAKLIEHYGLIETAEALGVAQRTTLEVARGYRGIRDYRVARAEINLTRGK